MNLKHLIDYENVSIVPILNNIHTYNKNDST